MTDIAHYDSTTDVSESIIEHEQNVADLASFMTQSRHLSKLSYLCGILHDAGKYSEDFQNYIQIVAKEHKQWDKPLVNHSSAGARYLYNELFADNEENRRIIMSGNTQDAAARLITLKIITWCIICHHGIEDVLDEDGNNKYHGRIFSQSETEYDNVIEAAEKDIDVDIKGLYEDAVKEVSVYIDKINAYILKQHFETKDGAYKEYCYFLGMLARYELSVLKDADCTATAEFMTGHPVRRNIDTPQTNPDNTENIISLWRDYQTRLTAEVANLSVHPDKMTAPRNEIFTKCGESASLPTGVYRLQVPTGGGKTLASMNFALNHAIQTGKKKIFYIAPYKSILDQTADKYKSIFQDDDNILEYHSSMINDYDSEDIVNEEHRHILEQSFDVPMILTTMVRFLNCLSSAHGGDIRRMHQFADSVIIVDEIQSLPHKCVFLFNETVNFLSLLGCTTILCSATQPTLESVEYPLHIDGDIIPDYKKYYDIFKRTDTIISKDIHTCAQISDFAQSLIKDTYSGIIILNTKFVVRQVYESLIKADIPGLTVIHLNTNMCPQHRIDKLNEFKTLLSYHRKVICVSTQLIEAGVDISADWVIRSYTGLDSVVQASGRCNRNWEQPIGHIYLVSCDEERLGKLPDITAGRTCLKTLLMGYDKNKDDITSLTNIDKYYRNLYNGAYKTSLGYTSSLTGVSLYDMLADNTSAYRQYRDTMKSSGQTIYPYEQVMCQSFKTAGSNFEVIDSDLSGVIVPYGYGADIIQVLKSNDNDYIELKRLLRSAQRYTVTYFPSSTILDDHIHQFDSCDTCYLDTDCYDDDIGFYLGEL